LPKITVTESIPSPHVIVIGSANIDLCMNLARLPIPGETLGGGKFRRTFGGKGANTAVAAAQAGGDVALIGCVGCDANGAEMLANLRAKNVKTSFMEEHPSVPTGVAFIFIDDQGQNMIGVAAGANDEVGPGRLDSLRAVLKAADLIVIQNEVPENTVEYLLQLATEDHLLVLYNCAPARRISPHYLAAVEWLLVNESEATEISGNPVSSLSDAEVTAQALLGIGVKNVLVTLGSEGVCVAQEGGAIFHVSAFPVQALDTVGAGDTFCGALAVACGEGQNLDAAVRFASAAAAISVTRLGAQNSAPNREEIEAFLKSPAT
jgi:ribokinase